MSPNDDGVPRQEDPASAAFDFDNLIVVEPTRYSRHGSNCTRLCHLFAVPSPILRDRPPPWPCPHCGAEPGVACILVGPWRRPLTRYGRFHPSRLEVAS